MNGKKRIDIHKTVILGLLTALAYLAVALLRIPLIGFLKYEPKDAIIAFAGLWYGPASAMLVAVLAALAEMLTISTTGPMGLLMNVLSTAGFTCIAALAYRRGLKLLPALLCGAVFMTVTMLGWNYLLAPYYMGVARAAVAELLLPMFLPFNLIKGALNTLLTWALFRPVTNALKKGGFLR